MRKLYSYDSERIYWAVEQVEQESGDIHTLHLDDSSFYLKSEADKVIAEKDNMIAELKDSVGKLLNAKTEQVMDEVFQRCLIYGEGFVPVEHAVRLAAEIVRLRRALWLARAKRAHAEWGHWATIWFCDTSIELNINKSSVCPDHHKCTLKRNAATWRNIWSEVERKCRAKAEEYK